ncbi:MAG TPA: glycosyltransferase family 1 protein [Microbacteriaceae bacterium]|nr:glycosyltransferase family 1 protein [Microbacteriaceae bacterium]
MSLLFDCRYVRIGHHDGISRFSVGLVTELSRLRPVTMLISDKRQLAQLPELPWVLGPSPTSPLEPFVARTINRLGFDTVFTPMQTMGSWGRRYRLALTVHDLIYYTHPTPPRNLPWFVRLAWRAYHLAWWPQRRLLNGSDMVVTVSETTRALIAEHRLTRRPVVVVPNAADALPGGAAAQRTPPSTQRFVYMGSAMPYKNVDTLVDAMRFVPGAELHLLSNFSPADRARLAARDPHGQVVFHDGVSDAEYAELLDSATAFVTASRDEGFGIPLIEAGSRATPVVVSDIPIFREVAGSAGVYFDPEDPADCARALRSLEDESIWRERSQASFENARRYGWAQSASALHEALNSLESRPA